MDLARAGSILRYAGAAGGVLVGGWAINKGVDGGFVKDIWAKLETASPVVSMILFLLLMTERKERREAQRQCNERTIDYIESTNMQTTASGRMAVGFRQLTDAVGATLSQGPRKRRR